MSFFWRIESWGGSLIFEKNADSIVTVSIFKHAKNNAKLGLNKFIFHLSIFLNPAKQYFETIG